MSAKDGKPKFVVDCNDGIQTMPRLMAVGPARELEMTEDKMLTHFSSS